MTDNRRETLDRNRKANFKIPNSNTNRLESSTYQIAISNQVAENALAEGRASLVTNLKGTSLIIGDKRQQLETVTESNA
jgi:hypothetical protein